VSGAFSPGPWAYRADRTIADVDGVPLMRCYAERNAEANGPLAAAAPELYEAGSIVLAGLNARIDAAAAEGSNVPLFDGIAALHAALAKARGDQ
jgi:hypothetical protein